MAIAKESHGSLGCIELTFAWGTIGQWEACTQAVPAGMGPGCGRPCTHDMPAGIGWSAKWASARAGKGAALATASNWRIMASMWWNV